MNKAYDETIEFYVYHTHTHTTNICIIVQTLERVKIKCDMIVTQANQILIMKLGERKSCHD